MKSIQVCQLDKDGAFIGFVPAYESPREPGTYHMPAGAVNAPLPRPIAEREAAKWNGQSFDYLPDWRSAPLYLKDTGQPIRAILGDTPESLNAVQAKPPTTGHQWIDEQWQMVLTEDQARDRRTALLLASDWTQLPDVPAATQQAWQPYRQALRDLTSQAGFPATINWPTQPE